MSCRRSTFRVYLLVLALVFGLSLLVAPLHEACADSTKPNIIVIVGDDMGYGDLGVQGSREIPTPNLDALANSGVRCTSGYVSGPYCSPTRAGLLTGRYQQRFGHEFNPGAQKKKQQQKRQNGQQARRRKQNQSAAANKNFGLPLSETTIADRLHAAGYKTALVGKWHLGNSVKYHPLERGFDEFYGFLGGAHSYLPGSKPLILRDTTPIDEKEYLTDAFAREAVAFIDKHQDEPFFLYLAFNAVHTPMHATDDRLAKFSSIENENRRKYAAMMSAMDDAVGAVVEKLRETKLEDNTLLFFISDNGGPSMDGTSKNASLNTPLRGSKRTTLEGGVRVPFFVKWPARLPAGKTYDAPVIQLDILPTALAAVGADAADDAKLDGVDLVPYLTGTKDGRPHDQLFWRLGQQMAIRDGDWKLVRYDPRVDDQQGKATTAKLYNLANDIGEKDDLMDKEPEKAKALQSKWDEWNKSNVSPLWGESKNQRAKAENAKALETSSESTSDLDDD
jgi:arylsulfatase A-like enzyme